MLGSIRQDDEVGAPGAHLAAGAFVGDDQAGARREQAGDAFGDFGG